MNYAAILTSQTPLTRKQERTAKLVGRKSLVQCNLGGIPTTVLWDTGSQVSIVDMDWKNTHLPDTEIRPVQELLDEGMLDLTAANGTEIPYEGWIGVEFSLSANKDSELLVPLLVTPDPLAKPIIGFNVIEELAQTNVSTDRSFTSKFVHSLGSALDVGHKKARAVYSVLKKQKGSSEGQIARLGRQDVVVPKHKVATVVCGKLNKAILKEQYAILEPNEDTPWPTGLDVKQQLVQLPSADKTAISVVIENNTNDDIRLQNRTILGWLYAVDTVKDIKEKATSETSNENGDLSRNDQVKLCPETTEGKCNKNETEKQLWDPPVDLEHLTPEQQHKVRKMLREECEVFALDDWDTGCIPDLQST